MIDWQYLSANPAAIELLEANQDKIDYRYLSANPEIFTDVYIYDYEVIKNNFKDLNEEIIATALNPVRISHLMAKYGRDVVYDNYFS
jgi:hypothetical protein